MIIYRAENLKAYSSFDVFMEAPVMIIDINATQKNMDHWEIYLVLLDLYLIEAELRIYASVI